MSPSLVYSLVKIGTLFSRLYAGPVQARSRKVMRRQTLSPKLSITQESRVVSIPIVSREIGILCYLFGGSRHGSLSRKMSARHDIKYLMQHDVYQMNTTIETLSIRL